jgi:hypothetical protein
MHGRLVNHICVSTCLVFAMAIVAIRCVAQDASPSLLSKDDRAMLLSLIGDPLTDPTGKQHCTVTIVARTCWGTSSEVDIGAWYQPASETVPARVYFTDNDWIAAPTEFKHRDFVAESEELLAPDEDVQKFPPCGGARQISSEWRGWPNWGMRISPREHSPG